LNEEISQRGTNMPKETTKKEFQERANRQHSRESNPRKAIGGFRHEE
jgi:hypothetical protein